MVSWASEEGEAAAGAEFEVEEAAEGVAGRDPSALELGEEGEEGRTGVVAGAEADGGGWDPGRCPGERGWRCSHGSDVVFAAAAEVEEAEAEFEASVAGLDNCLKDRR